MTKLKTVSSVSEFLNEVTHWRTQWKKSSHKPLWFRGESCVYETALLPRLYREVKNVPEALSQEYELFWEFKRCSTQLTDTELIESYDWYVLMQHHGAPTRLLDWSDGALIALHFAVSRPGRPEGDAAVYILDPDWLRDFQNQSKAHLGLYTPADRDWFNHSPLPDEPLVAEPDHVTRRIAAQRGKFVVLGRVPDWLKSKTDITHSRLRTVRLRTAALGSIRAELRSCGITESLIFPDLDGLGREINNLWGLMRAPASGSEQKK